MNWSQDRYLQARMGATIVLLLITGFTAAIASGIIVFFAGGSLLILVAQPSRLLSVPVIVVSIGVAALSVVGLVLWGERNAPDHAVAAIGARPIEPGEYPQIRTCIRSFAQQIDAPMPSLYIAQTATPLSMTTGFRPKNARLIVSEGLLETLTDEECEAVIAHELAHVKNRDAAVMTAAALPVGATKRVLDLFSGPTAGVKYGQPSRADYADALMTVGLLLVIPVWVCTYLLTASLSRTREFAADRGAVAITGNPAALAAALERIDSTLADQPSHDLRSTEIASFSIIESTTSNPQGVLAPIRSLRRRAFATHPPTEERLYRLRSLTRNRDE